MQAFANRAAVCETLQTGLATFYRCLPGCRACSALHVDAELRVRARKLRLCLQQHHTSSAVWWHLHHRLMHTNFGRCSRSRKGRWCKGETSGHFIQVLSVHLDCDRDSLVYLSDPIGPACHTVRLRHSDQSYGKSEVAFACCRCWC